MATTSQAWTPSLNQGYGEDVMRRISRTISARSGFSDYEEPKEDEHISKAEDWALMPEVKRYAENDPATGRKLGVTWNNLTVKGVGADAAYNENVLSQFNVAQLIKEGRHPAPLRTIIDNSSGCVKPGEMLLVLGRPGAGCTTLLKMLSNRRAGYAEVDGDIRFGTMNSKEAQAYKGQIAMNTEDELFFPTLTVGKTMDFATRLKVPNNLPEGTETREQFRTEYKDFLLRSMGIDHTADTKVGNEYVRGVSGGERKRVSIIETLATMASVYCWDNSTRGLDASTALEYTRALRALTDKNGLATIVTLYQAGNGIYDLFDKVLVLDEGNQIYYGPRAQARPFMEKLGFICDDAANVADFLTGVTVPTERKIKDGFQAQIPRTAVAIRERYDKSSIRAKTDKELDFPESSQAKEWTADFQNATHADKAKGLPSSSPNTVGFQSQVKACVIRQYEILWGDKATFLIKQGSTLAQALIAGSLFYNAPDNSGGLFIKGGAVFLSLLFNALLAMSEVTDSFFRRPILSKHKAFGFYNPAAFCIAQIACDIPVLLFQISVFSLVLYFMVGLKVTAGAFFTYWLLIYLTTLVMTAMFRAIGAAFPTFDAASKVSGFAVSALITYIGYQIPKPEMHPWFVWIYWIDPMSYGFEALLANEFKGQTIACVNNNLIPNGPGYNDLAFQACTGVRGAPPGATSVTGEQYLDSLSYSASHIWRNVGILFAWWFLYVGITIFFTMRWDDNGNSNGFLLIPREKAHLVKRVNKTPKDEENPAEKSHTSISSADTQIPSGEGENEKSKSESDKPKSESDNNDQLVRNTSIFTWRNLTYTVKTPSGDRVLLDNIHGYVKPGMLGALMGSSGAGKTTLLDVLAQRKTDGTIKGEILVDGRPLSVSFQRSAGYCEQLDVHEPLTTVREALEFSALLRQSRDTPDSEKIAYVNTIIDLLELHDLEHTLIGKPGAGLSIEQRKRVTIGVELVSKPSILIFLDEPTSGLDGQAAFNTVRFLRKLADIGQAILVTIHQPSAQLFAEFDTLLLLTRGGKTVYFGDIGDGAKTIKDYFGRHDAACPPSSNPAEHMIDVCSGSLSKGKDWHQVWLDSPENKKMHEDLDAMIQDAAGKPPGTKDDGFEFATSLWTQTRLVTNRMNISIFRNTDYITNKCLLHIGTALFMGFSFWMIGDGVADLQLNLFAIFNYIFVAPGVIAQLQPLFIERRDVYEVREKKSKMYDWKAFTTGLIVSEIPYLVLCATLYFVCFYYTVGFPSKSSSAGSVFFVMLVYQFIYTGIGQFVAAYAPNAIFASLVNPLIIGTLVCFCGVFVPYSQIQPFWRYWLYYINPFNYLMGSLLVFTTFDQEVHCKQSEFAIFDPPSGQTCAQYLGNYLQGIGSASNLINPGATADCHVCQYTRGSDYLNTLNLKDYYYGWRDAAICVIFALAGYGLVFGLMKLRTKASKKAE